MTHRKIKDGDGKWWDVWEVYPSAVEQRMSGEQPAVADVDGSKTERRDFRVVVPSALQQGWLAFQAGNERRRLAPIPDDWIKLNDAALIALLWRADRLAQADVKLKKD
jgi:hypothetical protein